MRHYQIAFFIALVFAAGSAGAAFYLWFHPRPAGAAAALSTHVVQAPGPTNETSAPQTAEPQLSPVQLTPQRVQSIGVKTGTVEFKQIHDEIRTTGSV